jgi:transcriptional regulator with XRE-family HTH domain
VDSADAADLMSRFGAAVRRRRLTVGLGQEGLAARAGLHRTHVSLIERGRQSPTVVVVAKLAAALGVRMTDLMADTEAAGPPADDPPPRPPGRPRKTRPHPVADGNDRPKGPLPE